LNHVTTIIMARGKKYRDARGLIEKEGYSLDEALELLLKTSVTKFDSSCEVHFNLGVDPKQADQNIRTSVSLPHGTGKKLKIAAFVSDGDVSTAKKAGAVEAGTVDLVKKIEGGWTDFDIAVATPDQMKQIGKVAKILGQKRLMPSPKVGTVTPEFEKAIGDLMKGKIEVRVDKDGNLHNVFGKVSFDEVKLKENLVTLIKGVMAVKPDSQKGVYVNSISLTTSMGPGVPLDVNAVIAEVR